MAIAASTGKRSYDMSLRAQRSSATADRIRTAAWRRFSKKAFDEVTLAEVAGRAGVSVQTVVTHFGGKEGLFLAAYEAWARGAVRAREKADPSDPAQAVRGLLADYERDGRAALHMLAEEMRFPAVREMTERGRAYHRAWVGDVFAGLLEPLSRAERERTHSQLVLATDLLSWKLLRFDVGHSPREAEATILAMVEKLAGAL